MGHFDPDLMRTYEKHYGGHFIRYVVYHQVEESWYRELSHICHSACACVLTLRLMHYCKPGLRSRGEGVLGVLRGRYSC